jgi:hypothetical protein
MAWRPSAASATRIVSGEHTDDESTHVGVVIGDQNESADRLGGKSKSVRATSYGISSAGAASDRVAEWTVLRAARVDRSSRTVKASFPCPGADCNSDLAAMQFNQVPDQRQAHAGTFPGSALCGIGLVESA